MITPIQINYQPNNYNKNIYTKYKYSSTVFTGNFSSPCGATFERGFRSVEFAGRKVLNKISGYFNRKQTEAMLDEFSKVDEKSPAFVEALARAGRFFAKGKEVEINLESGRIAEIAKSNEPYIFIMNHDNQSHDPEMMALFNTLLNQEYMKLGQAKNCPRPRIILNEDILLSMDDKMRTIFEKLGAVGIDASLFSKGNKNAKVLIPLLKDFTEGRAHIYIFPEGKMAAFKGNLKSKFQAGVGGIVYRALGRREQVKVVPLGFAYNKKSKPLLSSIHVGEPVVFKKEGDAVLTSRGNTTSSFTASNYRDFFSKANGEYATITEHGMPITGKVSTDYIAGVLCENLRICTEEAKASLPKVTLGDKVIEY